MQLRPKDCVQRRTVELVVPLPQAYAIFRHDNYDAGDACFVPSNRLFDAEHVTPVTSKFCAWKRACLLPTGCARIFGGRATSCISASVRAAVHFGLQILA